MKLTFSNNLVWQGFAPAAQRKPRPHIGLWNLSGIGRLRGLFSMPRQNSSRRLACELYGLLALTSVALAALPAGYSHWTAEQMNARAKSLPAKMSKVKVATESLGGWGNHSMSLVHREGSGEAELHQTQSDILFIRDGDAAIVIGGTIPNGRKTTAHEIRGAKIEGGERQTLHPGDVLHIPPQTAHQMILEPGQKLDYYAVKVDAARP